MRRVSGQLTFQLPDSILISPGPHGFNVMVLPDRVVRIRGRSADHAFDLGRAFFKAVAQDRVFVCYCSISRDGDIKTHGRHLTVVRGSVVVSAGLKVPTVYDDAAQPTPFSHAGGAISHASTPPADIPIIARSSG